MPTSEDLQLDNINALRYEFFNIENSWQLPSMRLGKSPMSQREANLLPVRQTGNYVSSSSGLSSSSNVESTGLPGDVQHADVSLLPQDQTPSPRLSETAESFHMDMFAGPLTPLDSFLSPGISGMRDCLTELLATPINFSELGLIDPSLSGFTQEQHEIACLFGSDGVSTDPDLLSGQSQLEFNLSPRPSSSGDQSFSEGGPKCSDKSKCHSICGCMVRALNLINTLFSSRVSSSTSSSSPAVPRDSAPGSPPTRPDPLLEALLAENRESMEIVHNILKCECGEMTYLIPMLSIAVVKVLERYALTARELAGDLGLEGKYKDPDRPFSSSVDDDHSTGRTTAQLILNELHRVQGAVNLVERLLKEDSPEDCVRRGQQCPVSSSPVAFSPTTVHQMNTDLRSRLTSLSSEIINILRQS
ncbi:hypothetical protein CNMCM6936_005355 [Aspergillus lentulus]|uniref:Aflatoxin regulatory protein domain-containing protein n=1 Tax=Aspergillus lentulus TaxID=293939 RepID=A0AAN5YSD7_ASPLE|nr:hypothetical protein CNMCM6069_007925 [Aspergillus lentulus]KAF4167398.1 hypothetical protein CNMCM6936_005355 [Aspergillus lentulus]KAF4179014.1 hypothetical protein CNMCM8060_003774 [Aspergillus lentulus]KAF4188563.1 hypothetical protein CNMCM7927_001258 [Aspergillus lentulus]KAF4193625.1 hypothetical protein CNMCM8694_008597 [Aspergillus lentulus]